MEVIVRLTCWLASFDVTISLHILTLTVMVGKRNEPCDDSPKSIILILNNVVWEVRYRTDAKKGGNIDALPSSVSKLHEVGS